MLYSVNIISSFCFLSKIYLQNKSIFFKKINLVSYCLEKLMNNLKGRKEMKKLLGICLWVVLITVLCSGYAFSQSGTHETTGNDLLLKNVLKDSGTIKGLVYCPFAGEPLSGATVYLEGLSFTAITGDSGEFTLLYVPAGSHRLMVKNHHGELYDQGVVTVEENSTTDVHEIAVDCPVLGGTPCNDNTECAANEFCEKPPHFCSDSGACRPRPTVCPTDYTPVCGCDNATYVNECEATKAGASILAIQPCNIQ
jgi:hypothetical protein